MQQRREKLLERRAKQAKQKAVIERLEEQTRQLKWNRERQSLAEKVFEKQGEKQQKGRETKSRQ